MRRSSPSKVDRLAHAVIVAEAVFGERSIDLVGEPQWIVAGILGTGHSCICAPCLVNVGPLDELGIFNFVINTNAIAIFWTTIAFFKQPAAVATSRADHPARQASAPVLKRVGYGTLLLVGVLWLLHV